MSTPFFKLQKGDFWKYIGEGEDVHHYPAMRDYWEFEELRSINLDTIVDNKDYSLIGTRYFRYENGNYYYTYIHYLGCDCNQEVLYFKDNLKIGEEWIGSATSGVGKPDLYIAIDTMKFYTLNDVTFTDVIKIKSYDYTRFFAKDIGLIEEHFHAHGRYTVMTIIEHNK